MQRVSGRNRRGDGICISETGRVGGHASLLFQEIDEGAGKRRSQGNTINADNLGDALARKWRPRLEIQVGSKAKRSRAGQPSSLSAFPHECAKVAFGAWQTPAKPTFNRENRAF